MRNNISPGDNVISFCVSNNTASKGRRVLVLGLSYEKDGKKRTCSIGLVTAVPEYTPGFLEAIEPIKEEFRKWIRVERPTYETVLAKWSPRYVAIANKFNMPLGNQFLRGATAPAAPISKAVKPAVRSSVNRTEYLLDHHRKLTTYYQIKLDKVFEAVVIQGDAKLIEDVRGQIYG